MNLALKKFAIILLTLTLLPQIAFSEEEQSGGGQSSGMLVGLGALIGGTVASSIKSATEATIAKIGMQANENITALNMMTGLKINQWQTLLRQKENAVSFDQKMKDLAFKNYAQTLDRIALRNKRMSIENEEYQDRRRRREDQYFSLLLKSNEQRYKTLTENILTSRRQAQMSLIVPDQAPALTTQAGIGMPISVTNSLSVSRFPNSTQLMQAGNYGLTNKIARGSTASDLNTFTTSVASTSNTKRAFRGIPRRSISQESHQAASTGTH